MIDLPPVLDFEASSLSDCSYPITLAHHRADQDAYAMYLTVKALNG